MTKSFISHNPKTKTKTKGGNKTRFGRGKWRGEELPLKKGATKRRKRYGDDKKE
jgi:hypothetical protein